MYNFRWSHLSDKNAYLRSVYEKCTEEKRHVFGLRKEIPWEAWRGSVVTPKISKDQCIKNWVRSEYLSGP